MSQSSSINILSDIAGDVWRFPVWWYSEGLFKVLKNVGLFVKGYARRLALMVWVKNIFVPMFGRYDWQSRIISVFMRSVNIVFRGLMVLIVGIIGGLFFGVYVLLPIVSAAFLLIHASVLLTL